MADSRNLLPVGFPKRSDSAPFRCPERGTFVPRLGRTGLGRDAIYLDMMHGTL